MKISSQFDSGNIVVNSIENPNDIQLSIHKDNNSDFFQWFHFRLDSRRGQLHNLHIGGLEASAYPDGWENYQAVASYDRQTWLRLPTTYANGVLSIECEMECDQIYIAYFAPYSYERHLDLISLAQCHDICQVETLGQTVDQRDMTLIRVGEPAEGKKKIWITARQHPGETMAEWFVEGVFHKLLDDEDAHAAALLNKAVFYIVPNMNPDGSARGHLRTNAVGRNLNREWQSPCQTNSPEVFYVREKMLEVGLDMFLDIHGDEAIPYNFVAGCEGVPSYDARHQALEEAFKAAMHAATPEFQDVHGYDKDEPGQANLTVGAAWVGEQFKTLSYTVEMPFKDNIGLPDPDYGWSDRRSYSFGQDTLIAVLNVIDKL